MTQPVSDEQLSKLKERRYLFGDYYWTEAAQQIVDCLRELQSARQELAELRKQVAYIDTVREQDGIIGDVYGFAWDVIDVWDQLTDNGTRPLRPIVFGRNTIDDLRAACERMKAFNLSGESPESEGTQK